MDELEKSDNSEESSGSEDDESASSTSGRCAISASSQIQMCDRTEPSPSSSEDSMSYTSVLSTPEKPQVEMEDNKKEQAENPPIAQTTADEKDETATTPKEGEQANSSSVQEPMGQLQDTVSRRNYFLTLEMGLLCFLCLLYIFIRTYSWLIGSLYF